MQNELLKWFKDDDRYDVITPSDIEMHGGEGTQSQRVVRAASWMLDTDNSEGFCAVLDPEDMQVATRNDENGVVEWEPLIDFAAANQ